MDRKNIERTLKRIALEICEKNSGLKNVFLVGIKTRGVPMAKKIAAYLEEFEHEKPKIGVLDITFYRDDLSRIADKPITTDSDIEFDVQDANIILVDDVLYTGRTLRAALDAILDYGRPKTIQLCVLIDRGHHEMPVVADYVGRIVPTSKNEVIEVSFDESDGEENVKIMTK